MSAYVDLEPHEERLARELAGKLAEELTAAGWLRSQAWRDALARTPRHHFAPKFELPDGYGGGGYDGSDRTHREAWLRSVYDMDATLLTRFDEHQAATSSCSAPSVVIAMLEALDVADGDTVLEIGTGTGWNSALLATRLGSASVTSVDNQEGLVSEARQRLAALGLEPTLVAADGLSGYPPRVPYDRIIGTCAVVRSLVHGWRRPVRAVRSWSTYAGRLLAAWSTSS